MIEDKARDADVETPESQAHEAASPSAAEPDNPTRGMLRGAIQKVLDQIAHHEAEAKKHLQQAQELRKDLRESFAFFQDRGPKGKLSGWPMETNAAKAPEPTATAEKPAPTGGRRRRAGRRKKRGAAKGQE